MGKGRHSGSFYSTYSASLDSIWCREHGKYAYVSRKVAKRVMSQDAAFQRQQGKVGKVYPCEGSDPQRFHIGHTTPQEVEWHREHGTA